jgi:hypothetical protein
VRVGVRMVMHRGQYRYPRTRDAQGSPAQHALKFRRPRHPRSLSHILETIQIRALPSPGPQNARDELSAR